MQALKTTRKHQTTSARHIQDLRELGVTVKQISVEFGVTTGSIGAWLHENRAPYWTKVATEGLKRRMNKYTRDNKIILLKVPQEHLKTIESLIKGLEIEVINLNGS